MIPHVEQRFDTLREAVTWLKKYNVAVTSYYGTSTVDEFLRDYWYWDMNDPHILVFSEAKREGFILPIDSLIPGFTVSPV